MRDNLKTTCTILGVLFATVVPIGAQVAPTPSLPLPARSFGEEELAAIRPARCCRRRSLSKYRE